MEVISASRDVLDFVTSRRSPSCAGCILVPTMGALHAGHRVLIRHGAELARERGLLAGCIVTIFVNPTQFNEKSDFTRYPRPFDADVEACRTSGAACVLAPEVGSVYPPDDPPPVPALPPQATEPGLEDAARPGHFAGVCQVVLRLFDMVRPEAAVFGEKDWQQLQVVSEMVRRRRLAVDVVGVPTVREPDGLAMSSRNVFLLPTDRARARAISRALASAGAGRDVAGAERSMREVLGGEGIDPEYAAVRPARSLVPPPAGSGPASAWRALIAARVGSVRLLDNAPWNGPDP